MPPETQTSVQQADHTLAEPALYLMQHMVYGLAPTVQCMEDFLYFLVCTTDLDARDLVKAISEFTATKEG